MLRGFEVFMRYKDIWRADYSASWVHATHIETNGSYAQAADSIILPL